MPGLVAPRLRPTLWLLTAPSFHGVFLVYPTIDTICRSLMDRCSEGWVGFANYEYFFTRSISESAAIDGAGPATAFSAWPCR